MKSGSSSPTPGETTGGLSSSWDSTAKTLWEALLNDAASEVLVLNSQGKIISANQDAESFFGAQRGALAGTQYRDILPEAVAAERLAYVAEVARTGRRIILEGIVRGAWRHTSLRQLPAAEPTVLLVSRTSIPPGADSAKAERVRTKNDDLGILSALTTREREILALIGRGLSTVEIAQHLGRSVKTVEWHRVSLGTKLGVTNRVELAHIALRAGLAHLEVPGDPAAQTSNGAAEPDHAPERKTAKKDPSQSAT